MYGENSEVDCDIADAVCVRNPHFPNQGDLDDLIRDHGLIKSNAKLLILRLKELDLLNEIVQVTNQRKRHQLLSS